MRVQELSIQEPAWLERRVCRGEREMLGELGCEGWLVGGQAGVSLAFMVWLRSEAA